MTTSQNTSIELVKVLDPVLDDKKKEYTVYQGASQITAQQYTATNFSSSSTSFSFQPPSGVSIDRAFLLTTYFELTFAGSGVGNLLQIGSNDAPRRFPINQSLTNAILYLNNQSITQTNQWDFVDAVTRYFIDGWQSSVLLGLTPSYPDQFQRLILA